MKKLLTIFCLVLLSSYSYSEEVSEDQLVEREGVYYKKFSTTPFTGTAIDYYENGQLELIVNFKDGKQDGPYGSYKENGHLEYRGNYKNGKMDGLQEMRNEKGQLITRCAKNDQVVDMSYCEK